MGDIGEVTHEVEYEPLTGPSVPEPEQAPEPVEPREPVTSERGRA